MKKGHAPRTNGLTWLEHSFNAFNGTSYADRTSPKAFVESYIAYNLWKKRWQAVQLANEFYQPLLTLAEYLIENSAGSGHPPSQKGLAKFNKFRVE